MKTAQVVDRVLAEDWPSGLQIKLDRMLRAASGPDRQVDQIVMTPDEKGWMVRVYFTELTR